MPKFSKESLLRLHSLDPELQLILSIVIRKVDFVILEGHRGEHAQNIAFDTGRSKLRWPKGKHNKLPSEAVDIAPYYPDIRINWNDLVAFGRLMGYVQAVSDSLGVKLRFGMDWDGDWKTAGSQDPNEKFLDAPHVELVKEEKANAGNNTLV